MSCLPTLPLLLLLAAAPPSWVERSNENARVLLDVQARFHPETSGVFGIEGVDETVSSLPPDHPAQQIKALEDAAAELERRLPAERDPAVRQDLEIMIDAGRRSAEALRVEQRQLLPVVDPARAVFDGIGALLDGRAPRERHPAALARLRKYAGTEPGVDPLAVQAAALLRGRLGAPGLLAPFRDEIERQLNNSSRFLEGTAELFRKSGLSGWEEPFARLKEQVAGYDALLRSEVLPRARRDFRLPEELYRVRLRQRGIDMGVEEMMSRAKASFREIQNEMQTVAELVAKERKLPSNDYRDVIRALKREQLVGEAILPHYQQRVSDLEKRIRTGGVVTLPDRSMRVRLATEAESAAVPIPNVPPTRILGNTGESPEFVLPLRIPGQGGEGEADFDDFTFAAASWTLTAHEGRPGHELQFSSIVEKGVSIARVFYAFNSVNVEGWALYAEAEMKPMLPLDGQLIALQHRLLRAARAFLDPGLQTGAITREEALRVLEEEGVFSHAMAVQEVERYTFRTPGQAPSYFVGYSRLMELRTDAERWLGDRFDRKTYHDFLLGQGLLSPALLRKAVMEQFVPAQLGREVKAGLPASAPAADLRIESPRLARLAQGDKAALSAFWQEVEGKAPLVEPIPGDSEHVLVTFVWRGDAATERVALGGGMPEGCDEKPLQRLAGTDLWYRSERTPAGARFGYRFRPNGPAEDPRNYDEINARERDYPTKPDPLNPLTHPLDGSMVRLSPAAPLPAEGHQLRGKVQESTIESAALGGTRPLWIYTPPEHDKENDLLVVLDGRVGVNGLRVPALLEELMARGAIPPTIAVFIGNPSPMVRAADYMASTKFVDFLATELVPMVRTRYRVSRSPAAIAGVSLGGFAATFAAYTRPDVFGGVISLSGAHWYHPGWRTEPATPSTRTGWLTRRFAEAPPKPLRVFLAAGTMEAACPFPYLAENRRLADVLTVLGHPVRYVEFNGGHSVENWLLQMPAALEFVLGRP